MSATGPMADVLTSCIQDLMYGHRRLDTDPANRTVELPQAKSLNLRGLHRRQIDEEQPSASRSDSVRENERAHQRRVDLTTDGIVNAWRAEPKELRRLASSNHQHRTELAMVHPSRLAVSGTERRAL